MAKLFRCTIRGTVVGEQWANVVYMEAEGAQICVTELVASWIPAHQALTGNTTYFTGVTAVEVGHLILDPEYAAQGLNLQGQYLNAEHSDPQLACCFQLRTGLSGKKRRGRFFLAGVPDMGVEDGRIAQAWTNYLNTFQTAITTTFVRATADAPRLVVFSKKIFDGLTDIILDSYKPVTQITHSPVMSTMRSRKPGV